MRLLIFSLLFFCVSTLFGYHHCEVYNYFKQTEYEEVAHIITAVAVLESGWLKNGKHIEFNNYFSVKDHLKRHPKCKEKPIYCMLQFKSFEDNLDYMLKYFKRKLYATTEKLFLKKLKGYAKDPDYISKIVKLSKQIKCEV